jgi:hypothetical protein
MKINGHLRFHLPTGVDADGQIKNAIIERVATNPTSGDVAGRLVYNTTDNLYYFHNGTEWVPFSTGGDATAIQTEVDAIENASGGIFKLADGTYDVTVLDAGDNITNSSNLANAILQLDAAITGQDALYDLEDTLIGNGGVPPFISFLRYDDDVWADHVLVAADLTDVTSTATELNYTTGVTSAIQTQLTAGVTEDSFIRAFIGKTGAGSEFPDYSSVIYVTDGDTLEVATGKLDAALSALTTTVTSTTLGDLSDVIDGITGSLVADYSYVLKATDADDYATLALTLGAVNNIAAAVDSASTEDVLAFDGTAWTAITPATFAAEINITDIGDVTITTAASNAFVVFNGVNWIDMDGATARTAMGVYSTSESDTNFIDESGDSMTGELSMSDHKIVNLGEPSDAADAVTKSYVDSIAVGLDPKNSCLVATTVDLGMTYSDIDSGASDGVGDILTAAAIGVTTIDGVALSAVSQRILVKDQTIGLQNGIYTVTTIGAAGSPGAITVLTRAIDFDGSPANEVSEGAYTFIEQGTTQEHNGYVLTGTAAVPDGNIVVGNDTIIWVQATGAGSITAGEGLGQTGNTIFVNFGAGVVTLPTDQVGIDLYADTGLILTTDGTASSTDIAAKLAILVDGSTLSMSSAGIKVPASGITAVELAAAVAGDGLTGGAGSALSVVVDNSSIEINTNTLRVKADGITNAMMLNDFVNVSDGVNTTAVALGTTMTFTETGDALNVVESSGTVTISVNDATSSTKGVVQVGTGIDVTNGVISIDQTSVGFYLAADSGTDEVIGSGDTMTIAGSAATSTFLKTETIVSATDTITVKASGKTSNLTDVYTDGTVDKQVLVYNGNDGSKYEPLSIYYLHVQDSALTIWTVIHNLGQKYVNVTVVDSSDEVIIPQTILFDSADQLTVSFNTSVAGKVIVMGVADGVFHS